MKLFAANLVLQCAGGSSLEHLDFGHRATSADTREPTSQNNLNGCKVVKEKTSAKELKQNE